VRPCVALLHSDDDTGKTGVSVEDKLIPRLDAKEVAAVFTAPFHNFLMKRDEVPLREDNGAAGDWYEGSWTDFHSSKWRMHHFHVPIAGQIVTKPRSENKDQRAAADELEKAEKAGSLTRYRVFGMTARVLVDAVRVAYNQEPEFDHNSHFGDEDLIRRLQKLGRLSEKSMPGDELKREHISKASRL